MAKKKTNEVEEKQEVELTEQQVEAEPCVDEQWSGAEATEESKEPEANEPCVDEQWGGSEIKEQVPQVDEQWSGAEAKECVNKDETFDECPDDGCEASNEDGKENTDPIDVLEDFEQSAKEIDSKVNETTSQEELKELLEHELKRAEDAEETLQKGIEEAEESLGIEPTNSSRKNNNFSNSWNGVTEGWFN